MSSDEEFDAFSEEDEEGSIHTVAVDHYESLVSNLLLWLLIDFYYSKAEYTIVTLSPSPPSPILRALECLQCSYS